MKRRNRSTLDDSLNDTSSEVQSRPLLSAATIR